KLAAGIFDCGNIVEQSVEPDISHIVVVERKRYAPVEARNRPGDAQVLEGLPEKRQHFVSVPFGTDEVGIGFYVCYKPVLIFAHPEKIIRLLPLDGRLIVVRALSVNQFPLGVESLAPDAVEAVVSAKVDFTSVEDLLQHVLDDSN